MSITHVRIIATLILNLLFLAAIAQVNNPIYFAPELFTTSGSVCGFSPDGNTIYFTRLDTTEKKQLLYQARRKGNQWADDVLLSFSGIHNDVGGRLTEDGKSLYFTSDRPGGSNQKGDAWNIWVVSQANNQWDNPVPLNKINDKGMECCAVPIDRNTILFSTDRGKPMSWWILNYNGVDQTESPIDNLNGDGTWQWPSFIARKDVMLLNSMGRKDSRGMDDIYISLLKDEKWSIPINVGEPVNTLAYEDGAIVTPDGKWLIFNRHETAESPSRVMAVEWKPLLKKILRQSMQAK